LKNTSQKELDGQAWTHYIMTLEKETLTVITGAVKLPKTSSFYQVKQNLHILKYKIILKKEYFLTTLMS
jgi:hypothetical protein